MKNFVTTVGATVLVLAASGGSAGAQYDPMFSPSQGWQNVPAVSAAFHVEQWQWPAGYGIRLYVPNRGTADINVSVEGRSLLIHSEGEKKVAPGGAMGPVFMQFGRFSQWVTLPQDADVSQMKLSSRGGVINIFIPRKH